MLCIETSLQPEPTRRSPGFKKRYFNHINWGPKVRRMVDTYSESELAMQILLEANPRIKTYCEQFPRIDEYVNGKRLRNIFSFWIHYWDGTEELIQVVKKRNLISDEIGDLQPKRWADIQEWGKQHNFRCRFVVEGTQELKNKILIENWLQVVRFVQSGMEDYDQELSNRILGAVYAREILRISDLPKVFSKENGEKLYEQLFVLLHMGKVKIDLSQQILNSSFEVEQSDEIA